MAEFHGTLTNNHLVLTYEQHRRNTLDDQITYSHPDNPNIRFHDVGTPPPWAVDIQPYVEPPRHRSDCYTSSLGPQQTERVRELWDYMISKGVEENKIVMFLDLFLVGS